MRALRYRGPMLIVIALLVVTSAAWADITLLDFSGFDWFWPTDIGEVGSCYGAVGFVNSVDPGYLSFDYGLNQYTFHWDLACFVSADTFGTFAVYEYDGSTSSFNVYCDPIAGGTPAMFGINPPNGVSPSTWIDGDLVLGGMWMGNITIVVDLATGNGDVSGVLNLNAGSQLGNIPVDQRQPALTLAGVKFDPPNGPEGYTWQIDGQVFIEEPVPVEETSWGSIKQIGRGN